MKGGTAAEEPLESRLFETLYERANQGSNGPTNQWNLQTSEPVSQQTNGPITKPNKPAKQQLYRITKDQGQPWMLCGWSVQQPYATVVLSYCTRHASADSSRIARCLGEFAPLLWCDDTNSSQALSNYCKTRESVPTYQWTRDRQTGTCEDPATPYGRK